MEKNILDAFGPAATEKSIIKVIGVGGGGGNAVNHMYREGIHWVMRVSEPATSPSVHAKLQKNQ